MHIQVNTDNNLRGGEDVIERVQSIVADAVSHFAERITRIEAHLSDENAEKHGARDKRCMLEARINGLKPIAVTHTAESVLLAVEGASQKLGHALGRALGRLEEK